MCCGMTDNREVKHDEERHSLQSTPVTMGALGMWVPIGLTTVSLMVTLIGAVGSVTVTNSAKVTKLETEVEHLKETTRDHEEEIRSLRNYDERVRKATARGEP